MEDDGDDHNYWPGYRKPPRHTRFRKGRSGNPRGRPRGSRNLATLIREALNAPVEVREHGRLRKISKLQASAINFANRVAAGDPRALEFLFKNPALQREVAEARRRSGLTVEAFERAKLLVRGVLDLGPESSGSAVPGVPPRQPELSEVADRIQRGIRTLRENS